MKLQLSVRTSIAAVMILMTRKLRNFVNQDKDIKTIQSIKSPQNQRLRPILIARKTSKRIASKAIITNHFLFMLLSASFITLKIKDKIYFQFYFF